MPSTLSDRDRDLLFGGDAPRPGDAVVHFEHGLARYGGEEEVEVEGATHRLIAFEYEDGGRLLLPAREGRDFWAYGAPAEDTPLDRLDAGDWAARRDALIAEARETAEALVAEARARAALAAPRIAPDAAAMDAFAAGFGHDLTDDQSRAVEAVLADMARETPMDRLLVGDVGFGKTEVALRAAAAAASAGRQALIVAPTTVLARQHADEARARFGAVDVEVAELSRLAAGAERAEALGRIASGAARIVVGTTAVLAEDVAFADLALVVIDEEQKFGRAQKDDLRALAPGAHVLSMTATPIPRSLAAAEIGTLAVSVLAEAPGARRPVTVRLAAPEGEAWLDAVAAEVARGGQCFVVCPRIETAEALDARLAGAEGTGRHLLVHGRLPEEDLEARMLAFARGEADVLLSTALIESGLDLPRANAMVVFDADRFGLAQLHQLRGRIGRRDAEAEMLLLSEVDPADEDEPAARRLAAFLAHGAIGDGFRIARRDRDIRGFGDLGGEAQSGRASDLGIGLTRHVLRAWAEAGEVPEAA